jgi:FkbM family methyltransferase
MRTVNGIWAPDHDRRGWLEDLPLDAHGFPAYQDDRQRQLVRHGGRRRRLVDGGAHIGLYAVPLSRSFEHVEAFEPVQENFRCLRMNTAARRNILLHERALSAHSAPLRMTGKPKSSISWHVTENSSQYVEIQAVTIDSFGWDDVDAIKLDVEGHEFEALAGAHETIRRCKPVILIEEKHDPNARASKFLSDLGMKPKWKSKNDLLWIW